MFERKLDGIRCLAVKDGGGTRLYSRNELSLNDRYAPLAAALDADPADGYVIDGEAVTFVGGRDRFGGGAGGELFYYVFDVLVADGRDVRSLPLEERRPVLDHLLRWSDPLRTTEQMTGDGAALLAKACRDGWEGLIAKRLGTKYVSTRSHDWLKLKCTHAQELVIGGFTAPHGSRTDLGALLVGHFEGDRLRYAGKVGTGFSRATLRELSERLAPLVRDTSPFEPEKGIPRAATWVEPEVVAQIAFMEWTPTAVCATPPSWACASTSRRARSRARSRSPGGRPGAGGRDRRLSASARCRRALLLLVEPAGELRTRVHSQLPVDAGQVRLDGLDAEEQLRRDVLVRAAGGDEAGDLALLRGQFLGHRRRAPAQALAGRAQLAFSRLRPGRGAQSPEAPRGGAQLLPCLDPQAVAAQALAEAQPRAGRLERCRRALVPAERFLEVLPVVVGEQAGDARGDSRAPCVPRVLGVALERGQPPARRLDLFCAHRGLEEVGLPLKDAGLTPTGSLHARGDLLQLCERLLRLSAPECVEAPGGARVLRDHREAVARGDLVGLRGVRRRGRPALCRLDDREHAEAVRELDGELGVGRQPHGLRGRLVSGAPVRRRGSRAAPAPRARR